MKTVLTTLLAAAALLVAGCGEAERPAGGGAPHGGGHSGSKPPDQAFLQAMVPHHASAVEMAKVADAEARSEFVRELATTIERTQAEEIAEMRGMHERLFRAPLTPDMGAHAALGLSAEEAGMNHMDGASMIRGKRPFDRVFVEQMVPHHVGAVRMAEAIVERGRDPELRRFAREIASAQRREIRAMNRFREREFGGPVPTAPGGQPAHRPR